MLGPWAAGAKSGQRGLLLWALVLLFSLVAAPAIATADPSAQITEFSSGLNTGSTPAGMASGPDGNVWFTDTGTTKAIGRVTLQGVITEFSDGLNTGSSPNVITLGPDGNVWFTDQGTTGAIGRITPDGRITEFTSGLNTGSSPQGITVGPDGNLWFTDEGTTSAIGMVTPQGVITEFSSGLNTGSSPFRMALGPDGNLWFTDTGTTPAIGRVTPAKQITEFSTGLNTGSSPSRINAGSDGNLWFTDAGTTRAIGRITPGGTITEFSTGLNTGSLPEGISAGADGNLWFADDGTTSALGRITTAGTIDEFSSGLNPNSRPLRTTSGADGNVWFSDFSTATPAIGRVGTGAPAALQVAPAVSGAGRAGQNETCQNAQWATWAGTTVSLSLFGFDGFQWLRDGSPIDGQRGPNFVPQSTDIGHQLSCQVTVTYPVPFLASTSARSGAITVQAALPPPPSKALNLSRLSVSPGTFALTGRKVRGRCVGLTHANRRARHCRRTISLKVSFKLTVAARVTFTIKQSKTGRKVRGKCVAFNRSNRKKRRCSRIIQLRGSVGRNGTVGTNRFTFNGKIGGRTLRSGNYQLIAVASAGGKKTTNKLTRFKLTS